MPDPVVEVEDAAPDETPVVPEQAPAPMDPSALLAAATAPRVQAPDPFAPPPPAPPAAVPAGGGLQVLLPLVEQAPRHGGPWSAPTEVAERAVPELGKPSPTDTHPLELGGPVLSAPEEQSEEQPAPRRALDRAALLAGGAAGFVTGAFSGTLVTVLLS